MPGEIEKLGSSNIPELLLPEAGSVFAARSRRLLELAEGHPMRDYLRFFAEVARIQQTLLDEIAAETVVEPAMPVPDAEALARAREFSMPPLAVATWPRASVWQRCARELPRRLVQSSGSDLPAEALAVLDRVIRAEPAWLEKQASEILNELDVELDRAAAPFLAAALQVYWTLMVSRLGPSAFGRLEHASVCPCCGSRPTASVVRLGEPSGHRYLHCSLCSAQWHLVRIKCSHCETTEGIEYLHVEDRYPNAKAECCSGCGSYLKIFYQDKDPAVEPMADDLGTLALDLMLSETTDKQRSGRNLALFHGES